MKLNVQIQNTPAYLGNIASRLIGICLTHTTLHIHSSTDSGGSLQEEEKTYPNVLGDFISHQRSRTYSLSTKRVNLKV